MSALLTRLNARFKGLRTYLVALVLGTPDLLQALGAVDFSALFPAEQAAKVSVALMVLRILVGFLLVAHTGSREAR